MAHLVRLEAMQGVTVAAENKKSTDYVDKLFNQLYETLKSAENDMQQVILTKDAPRFHYSLNDKMYVEIKNGAELYLMKNKEIKDGKAYVYSPWSWNSGRVFLILEEYLVDLEPN